MKLKRQRIDIVALRCERNEFEAKYGLPSSRMIEAFTTRNGFRESEDFLRWSHIHTLIEKYGSGMTVREQ